MKIKDYLKELENKIDDNKLKSDIFEKINYDLKEIENKEFNQEVFDNYLDEFNNDGSINEIINSNIDIYYYALRLWAVDNYDWIEQAIEEICTGETDFHKMISYGQYLYFYDQAYDIINTLKEGI